jgi:hypothetical protein
VFDKGGGDQLLLTPRRGDGTVSVGDHPGAAGCGPILPPCTPTGATAFSLVVCGWGVGESGITVLAG